MAVGPNQTGQALKPSVQGMMGYGQQLSAQVDDAENEKRKKAMRDGANGQVQSSAPALSAYLGFG